MPPVVIAAGVAAVGAVGSSMIGSKAASKASKRAATAQQQQIAASNANRDYQYDLNAPTIARGGQAEGTIAGLLGLGDAAASGKALDTFKGATGYQTRLTEGLTAVNNNRFAGGMGQSGATLKALQQTGQNYASNELGNYMGQLGGLAAAGTNARGLVAGVGGNSVNQFINASQNGTNAQNQFTMQNAQNQQGAIQGLINAGLYAYGSSYGGNKAGMTPGFGDPYGTRGGGWYS